MKKEIIIDLRAKEDYEKEHLNNAINIPSNEIINGRTNFNFEKCQCVKCYCYSGNRSKQIVQHLKEQAINCIDLGSFEDAKKIEK
ncbi:MAG: rhodanese-like domain-containing protein [Mycoplasmoidaceae bacterium]